MLWTSKLDLSVTDGCTRYALVVKENKRHDNFSEILDKRMDKVRCSSCHTQQALAHGQCGSQGTDTDIVCGTQVVHRYSCTCARNTFMWLAPGLIW